MSSRACPFGHGRDLDGHDVAPFREHNRDSSSEEKAVSRPLPTGKQRIRVLYEEYINLHLLKQVWDNPATDKPVLEPCFAAAFHGIELCFLLLAEFISDDRKYVAKRPRVELVAEDIATQCKLLTELIDGELEEEDAETHGGPCASRLTLTQPFPFEGCPPTTPCPSHSPGLQRLVGAVGAKVGTMSTGERNSLIKLVLNMTTAFAAFERWTVGLGIEHQLGELRAAVGLDPLPARSGHLVYLDYGALVQPGAAEETLTGERFTHKEDFFFRTIHLGTECWAFVAHNRLRSAQQAAQEGHWHVGAARAAQAARILHYLGAHVLLLTRMNLRDYLQLKVELEGTSGEGSLQVKALRPTVTKLFEPLAAALLPGGHPTPLPSWPVPGKARSASTASGCNVVEQDVAEAGQQPEVLDALQEALLRVYEAPDKHAGLYNYAKALEDLETGLLGGFFYKHFVLACNVIGSDARGTMRRAVQALKSSYETPIFPRLDAIRSQLGRKVDEELAPLKGRMMDSLMQRYSFKGQPTTPGDRRPSRHATGGAAPSQCAHASRHAHSEVPSQEAAAQGPAVASREAATTTAPRPACPFAGATAHITQPAGSHDCAKSVLNSITGGSSSSSTCTKSTRPDTAADVEAARQRLYSWDGVPPTLRGWVAEGLQGQIQELGLVCHTPPGLVVAPGGASSAGSDREEVPGLAKARVAHAEQVPQHVQQGEPCRRPLSFLDHCWGQVSPQAQLRALQEAAAMQQLGNPAWDLLFGRVMPQAVANVKRLLGLLPSPAASAGSAGHAEAASVQFGHNTHELVTRLLSALLAERQCQAGASTVASASAQHAQQPSVDGIRGTAAALLSRLLPSLPKPSGSTASSTVASPGRSAVGAGAPLRVLTSDSEFYSFVRQANRLVEAGWIAVEAVAAEPAEGFAGRCAEAVRRAEVPFDMVYVSQVSYGTQRTLLPDILAFVDSLEEAATAARTTLAATACAAHGVGAEGLVQHKPVVVIDGYHGFCALPTDLSRVAGRCCYTAGLLKHAGCGPNAAFMVLPTSLTLRPLLTGWLADPSVLAPGSKGVKLGSEVGYCPDLALQGGTPGFLLPLLTFNNLVSLWDQPPTPAPSPPPPSPDAPGPLKTNPPQDQASQGQDGRMEGCLVGREASPRGTVPPACLSVGALHGHVMGLHARFLGGLRGCGHPGINLARLLPPQDEAFRSHTLVFAQEDGEQAKRVVEALAARGVLVDCRSHYVRVGFGANHSAADVDSLLAALRETAQA